PARALGSPPAAARFISCCYLLGAGRDADTRRRSAKITETPHPTEIKHAPDVRSFRAMRNFHAIAGRPRRHRASCCYPNRDGTSVCAPTAGADRLQKRSAIGLAGRPAWSAPASAYRPGGARAAHFLLLSSLSGPHTATRSCRARLVCYPGPWVLSHICSCGAPLAAIRWLEWRR